MIIVFPETLRAETSPLLEMVATPVLLDVQGLIKAAIPDPVNRDVVLTQRVVFPEIVGVGFTVMAYEALQP